MNTTAMNVRSTTVDIDALLQDSYLLVVELLQGASAQNSEDLWAHCVKQVERVREGLKAGDVDERSIDLISHAHCALLDETVLSRAKDVAHTQWASEPLQAKFFSHHQAGESLYEDMREVLRQPAPDLLVLTAFERVLMLGFRGRYRDIDAPEREQLLTALTARVAPLRVSCGLTTRRVGSRKLGVPGWLQMPLSQVAAAALLLGAVWWGLDHLLGGVIATLLSGQA